MFLEIRQPAGKVETRELSKKIPLLVGRLPANDIRVNVDGVAPVHCRISWNRRNFEVAAATPDGVEWNGATVQQAMLSPGDVVRVGDVEIAVHAERPVEEVPAVSSYALENAVFDDDTESNPLDAASAEMLLKPVTGDELPVRSFQFSSELSHAVPPVSEEKSPPPSTEAPPAPPAPPLPAGRSVGMQRVPVPAEILSLPDDEDDDLVEKPILLRRSKSEDKGLAASTSLLKEKLKGPPRRPGEQEVLRSPLVLGLGVGTLVLLLAGATIWFVLNREAAEREFKVARAQMDSGQYAQAIEAFEQFLHNRPRHGLADEARLAIATARVEQPISGSVPAWDAGLQALDGFINQYRDTKPFQDIQSTVRQYVIKTADRIAMGAAEGARTGRKQPLLAVSASAVKVFELYSPPDNRPTDRLQEIARTVRAAEAAILERETFDGVVRKMDDALTAKTPLAALPEYRRLLDRYSTALEYRPLNDRLKKSLALEQSQTTHDESRREAIREDRPPATPTPPLTLTRRIRTRSDLASVGNSAFVVAEDCLYGVDTITGEPLWRRVVGFDLPFPPLVVAAGVPSVLVYDTRYRDLLLVEQRTGKLVWRLALEAAPQGLPLVHEGQILVATAAGTLEQVDLQSGASSSRLKFSQGVVGPPVVSMSGERLYVPGHANVLYVLSRRPLACEQVTWLGHGPGAIAAPALMMRAYLLLVENDRADSAQLRVFDTAREDQPPRPIAQERIDGQVLESPIIRGKQLVIPASPERVSAFTVAETGNQQSLALVASYQVKNAGGSPVFVALGADDQLWMLSSALRRLTISRDSLLPDKQEMAVGLASQPLQLAGDAIYVGRRLFHSRAVIFSEADRNHMTTQWQTSLGAQVLAGTAPSADGATLCVTSLGDLFQVSVDRVTRGGFELQSLGHVAVPEGLNDSLSASRLGDGRLAIWCGGSEPRLWITGNDAVIRELKLTQPLQAAPVSFGPGVLLPLAGRLRLVGRNGDAPIAEDLPAPVSESAAATWQSVVPLDDTQALALNSHGRLARIQFRTSPVAHLAEITDWEAGRPVDQKLAVDRSRALVVDAAGRLVLLDASSFEPLGEFMLDQPASQAPLSVDDQAFVEVGGSKLVCFDLTQRLARQWELPLNGASLLGSPARLAGKLLIAFVDGRLLLVDPMNGEVTSTVDLKQRLGFGPQLWGQHVIVGTLDGSLLVVDRLFGQHQ